MYIFRCLVQFATFWPWNSTSYVITRSLKIEEEETMDSTTIDYKSDFIIRSYTCNLHPLMKLKKKKNLSIWASKKLIIIEPVHPSNDQWPTCPCQPPAPGSHPQTGSEHFKFLSRLWYFTFSTIGIILILIVALNDTSYINISISSIDITTNVDFGYIHDTQSLFDEFALKNVFLNNLTNQKIHRNPVRLPPEDL